MAKSKFIWLEPESFYAGLKNLAFTFKLSKNITCLGNQYGSCALGDLKGRKIKKTGALR